MDENKREFPSRTAHRRETLNIGMVFQYVSSKGAGCVFDVATAHKEMLSVTRCLDMALFLM